jgi:hypothetical protein
LCTNSCEVIAGACIRENGCDIVLIGTAINDNADMYVTGRDVALHKGMHNASCIDGLEVNSDVNISNHENPLISTVANDNTDIHVTGHDVATPNETSDFPTSICSTGDGISDQDGVNAL